MITLYGTPNSRSTRVAWALEEAKVDYEFIKIDLRNGEGRTPDYLSINPGGKVPALAEDGFVLTESAAIVTYIGDRYPESQLTPPAATQERGLYEQWCFFAMTELEQPLWTMAKHQFALPEEWRVPSIIDTAQKEFLVALKIFELALGDETTYILGDTFSGADILLALTLGWANKAGVLPLDSSVRSYMERCIARPALARAREREI